MRKTQEDTSNFLRRCSLRRAEKTERYDIKVPPELYDQVASVVRMRGMWLNEAEFVREALREKISVVVPVGRGKVAQASP